MVAVDGDYNFTVNWDYTLAGAYKTIFGIKEFKIQPNTVLSYELALQSSSVTSALVNISPTSLQVNITSMSFTVMVFLF